MSVPRQLRMPEETTRLLRLGQGDGLTQLCSSRQLFAYMLPPTKYHLVFVGGRVMTVVLQSVFAAGSQAAGSTPYLPIV